MDGLVAASTMALLAVWVAFRVWWWKRMHYQTLFGRSLPAEQVKQRLFKMLAELDRVLGSEKIPYWLDWGTLLGAWRHQGFIPWDDDLDVTIRHDDHARLYASRDAFQAPWKLVLVSQFWSLDKLVPGLARRWPCQTFLRLLDTDTQLYIDIFEVGPAPDNRLHVLPLSRMHPQKDHRGRPIVVDQAMIFPLRKLPFEGGLYPTPNDTQGYLRVLYGDDLSPNRQLDPASGKYLKKKPVTQVRT